MLLTNMPEIPRRNFKLRDDMRLLVDALCDQEGDAVFGIVERIRRTSVRFRRDEDEAARRELESVLDSLSRGQTTHIIRALRRPAALTL